MRYILGPEEVRKYATRRLLPKGSDVLSLKKLKSLNIQMMMTEDEFKRRNGLNQEIEQDFRRESIFLNDGHVHIPIIRGFYRLKHYNDIVRHLNFQGLKLDFNVEYHGGDPHSARDRLDHLAKNLAEEINSTGKKFDMIFIGPLRSTLDTFFGDKVYSELGINEHLFRYKKEETADRLNVQEEVLSDKYKRKGMKIRARTIDEILKDEKIDSLVVSNIIHDDRYHRQTRELSEKEGVERIDNDFLDYQIFEKDGKTCLGLNYVYGDQAFYLLKHFFNEYVERDNKDDLRIIMHGKVGNLIDGAKRGDVIFPSGVIKGNGYYPMDTQLLLGLQRLPRERYHIGGNIYAVDSVLDQTYEGLEDARLMGCTITELEAENVLRALEFCKQNIEGMPKVKFNFLGYTSDVPMIGDTLAEELADYSVLYSALNDVFRMTREN